MQKDPTRTCGCCSEPSPYDELCGPGYVYEISGHSPENLLEHHGRLLEMIREVVADGMSPDMKARMEAMLVIR